MTLLNAIKSNVANISGLDIRNAIRKVGAGGSLFTQEQVWEFIVANYGYIHYGSINPVFNDMCSGWGKEGLTKIVGKKGRSMFGGTMSLYKLTKYVS